MEQDKPDSSFVFFAKRLEYVPRYAMDYFFGLLAAIVSDVIVTTIALAAVTLGLAVGHWWLVVAFFFTMYSLLRIVGIVGNAIASTGQIIAALMRQSQQPPMIVAPPVSESVPNVQEEIARIPVTLPPV